MHSTFQSISISISLQIEKIQKQQSSKKKEIEEIAILWIKRKTYAKLNQMKTG